MKRKRYRVNREKMRIREYNRYELILTVGAILAVILFIGSLIPLIHVGVYNYATGDDYWYGVNTYRGFIENGLMGALKGSLTTVREFYYSWQGTWFTIFLFTLSPNHFWENGYVLTVFLSLGLLISSVSLLSHYYLREKLLFRKSVIIIIDCLVLNLMIQYIPRTTSGIYWFNGIMHYSVPFFLATLAVIYSHKYIEEKGRKNYSVLFLCFLFLGGGSYLAPIAATLVVCMLLLNAVRIEKTSLKNRVFKIRYNYKNLWILLAIVAEVIGLIISFLAPGNNVRGGEEFGADLKWAIQCIFYAIDRGIYLGEDYFKNNMVTTISFVLIAVLIWNELWEKKEKKLSFRYPLLFVVFMNGVYWAIYTPEIYSRSAVSGGVPNTYFHVFLLVTMANIIYVHGWIQNILISGKLQERIKNIKGKKLKYILLTVICLLWIGVVIRSDLITTYDYCREYIRSGKMERYFEVRKEQHRILSTSEEDHVIIPEMEGTYPLTNMCLTENVNAERNVDRAKYYNKKSVGIIMVE